VLLEAAPHSVSAVEQLVPQLPPEHTWPGRHTAPHAPQLVLSVLTAAQ
jgi:hypothetical protein